MVSQYSLTSEQGWVYSEVRGVPTATFEEVLTPRIAEVPAQPLHKLTRRCFRTFYLGTSLISPQLGPAPEGWMLGFRS